MQKSKTRIPEISVVNVILCLLVVFAHVTSDPIIRLSKGSIQYSLVFFPWRFSHFAMQGFIFLSGLRTFLGRHEGFNYKSFFSSRFTKILIPYLVFNVIYLIYYSAIGYFPFSLSRLAAYIVRGNIVSPFYFIVVLVQLYALLPLWNKLIRSVKPLPLLTFAMIFTFLCKQWLPDVIRLAVPGYAFKYNDRIFTSYLFYWLAGSCAGLYYDGFKRLLREKRKLITIVFSACAVCEAVLGYFAFSRGMHVRSIELVHYAYCVSAVFFLYMLAAAAYENRSLKSRLIREIDASSYFIFLVHCLAINCANLLMPHIGLYRISAQYIFRVLTVFPVSIGVSILVTHGIRIIKRRICSKL